MALKPVAVAAAPGDRPRRGQDAGPPPTDPATDLRTRVLDALRDIAPEADLAAIAPAQPLRDQVDLDSMDWLSLLDALGERLGTALPPGKLGAAASLDDLVAALGQPRRVARRRAPASALRARVHRLDDGRRVRVRPIVAADTALEADFVRNLSTASRYKRFMSSLRELTPAKLKYFTDVDQVRHIALAAAEVGQRRRDWIGVARCVADPGGDACEFAVTVADRWHRSGLAGVLMRALMAAARERGLQTMRGIVLSGNRRMLRLARQLGFSVAHEADEPGTVTVTRPL